MAGAAARGMGQENKDSFTWDGEGARAIDAAGKSSSLLKLDSGQNLIVVP